MPDVSFIRPGGNGPARDLADWAGSLSGLLAGKNHPTICDINEGTPCDRNSCEDGMSSCIPAIWFFFGHGTRSALLDTSYQPAIDGQNLQLARGTAFVSVACEAGRDLGAEAINAGVRAHIGWNVRLLWVDRPLVVDPFRDAILESLAGFADGASVQEVAGQLRLGLLEVADEYAARSAYDPNLKLAYYATAAASGQVAIDGDLGHRPLESGHPVRRFFHLIRWNVKRAVARRTRGGRNAYGP